MSETKHTLVSYDCSGPTFAMAEPACDSETYLKEATRKLAEHPHLVAELDRVRSINADMLAALEAVIPEEGHSDWWCPTCKEFVGGYEVTYQEVHEKCGTFLGGVNDPEWITKARAAIAKAKGGAK